MIQVFDLKAMLSYSYDKRDKNVFYKTKEFKTRIIELPQGGEILTCDMVSYVIFYVVKGSEEVKVNEKNITIREG